MDGPSFRARYAANLINVCDTLVRHFSEDTAETRQLVAAITEVAQSINDLSDPDAVRAPTITLANLIGDLEPAFFFDSLGGAQIFLARALIRSCMKLGGDFTQPADVAHAAPMPRSHLTFADILAQLPVSASVVNLPTSADSGPVVPRTGNQTKSVAIAMAPANNAGSVDVKSAASAMAPATNAGNVDQKKKKCGHCDMMIGKDHTAQLQHAWKKHKDQVHKLLHLNLVCGVDYCDYVGSTVHSKRIHEGRTHGAVPASQQDVVQALEPGPCRYCGSQIDTLISFKQHTLQCKQRDSRPPLGCTGCAKEFQFIYDFITHLRIQGGPHHGKPVPLKD